MNEICCDSNIFTIYQNETGFVKRSKDLTFTLETPKQSNHSLTTRTVDIAHYTSWRNGIYYFRALPLKEIVKQLERIFNVNICITSSNIEDIILTGDFLRGENLEQILRVITADKRLKYRIEEYMIYIDENKRARKRIY